MDVKDHKRDFFSSSRTFQHLRQVHFRCSGPRTLEAAFPTRSSCIFMNKCFQIDSVKCGICRVIGQVHFGDGNEKNCCSVEMISALNDNYCMICCSLLCQKVSCHKQYALQDASFKEINSLLLKQNTQSYIFQIFHRF